MSAATPESATAARADRASNPYVFVVGCPRSGTTLLQRMLDNHPMLAVANDSHFIPRMVEDQPDGTDPPLTPQLVERVRGYKRVDRLGLSEAAVDAAAAASSSYTDLVRELYTAYALERGKELAGEKTPDYVKWLPRLHGLFPAARSVHIIRDGRDVALSVLEWAYDGKGPSKLALWDEEPVAVCALWWRWQVGQGRRDGAALGPARYHELTYETLVARPEQTLARTAAFLGLPDAPEMAAYYVGRTTHLPGRSAKGNWLPPTAGLRDWRTALSERDRALFHALAGDLLAELGYPPGVDEVPAEIAEVAARCARWWAERRSHNTHAVPSVTQP